MNNWNEKRESLRTHLDFVALLRERNRKWERDTDNVEIAMLHGEIADFFEQTLERYKGLLDKYQNPPESAL